MATVYIPALLRELVGRDQVEVEGATVRQVIENLDHLHPGVRERLIDGSRLRTNVSVAVDGEMTPLGLLAEVEPQSEVHFVQAISGGVAR